LVDGVTGRARRSLFRGGGRAIRQKKQVLILMPEIG